MQTEILSFCRCFLQLPGQFPLLFAKFFGLGGESGIIIVFAFQFSRDLSNRLIPDFNFCSIAAGFQLQFLHLIFQHGNFIFTGSQCGGGDSQFFAFFCKPDFDFTAEPLSLSLFAPGAGHSRFQNSGITETFQPGDLFCRSIPFRSKTFYIAAGGGKLVLERFGKLVVDFCCEQFAFFECCIQFFPQLGILRPDPVQRGFQIAELFRDRVVGFGKIIALFDIDDQVFFEFCDFIVQDGDLGVELCPDSPQVFQFCSELAVFFPQDDSIGFDFFGEFICGDPSGAKFTHFRGGLLVFPGFLSKIIFESGDFCLGIPQGCGQFIQFG